MINFDMIEEILWTVVYEHIRLDDKFRIGICWYKRHLMSLYAANSRVSL